MLKSFRPSSLHPNTGYKSVIAHRKIGEHEILPLDGKALQPAQEQGDVVVLRGFDVHIFHTLLDGLTRREFREQAIKIEWG